MNSPDTSSKGTNEGVALLQSNPSSFATIGFASRLRPVGFIRPPNRHRPSPAERVRLFPEFFPVSGGHLRRQGPGCANSLNAANARGPQTVPGPPFIMIATPIASATSASVALAVAEPFA